MWAKSNGSGALDLMLMFEISRRSGDLQYRRRAGARLCEAIGMVAFGNFQVSQVSPVQWLQDAG